MNRVYVSVVLVVALMCTGGAVVAGSITGTMALGRAAVPSSHPDRVMLMAVARAGARLVSVGENGTVTLSDDDGRTWRTASMVPVSVTLTKVAFATDSIGWAIGHQGVVLRTDDGGETWVRQADGISLAQESINYWSRLASSGSKEAEVQLDEARRLLEEGPEKPLLDLLVENEKQLVVVGAFGVAFQSTDGGRKWVPLADLENEERLHLYGLTRVAGRAFIAGEQGLLLHGGQALASPYDGSFFGVVSDGREVVVAYGLRGNLAISVDAGEQWQTKQIGSAAFTCGVRLADGRLLLCNQAGQVFVGAGAAGAFERIGWQAHAPLTDVVQLGNGDLIFSSLAGITRLAGVALAPVRDTDAGVEP